jgi:hypothetical protein
MARFTADGVTAKEMELELALVNLRESLEEYIPLGIVVKAAGTV